jgi:hypothetical protein
MYIKIMILSFKEQSKEEIGIKPKISSQWAKIGSSMKSKHLA